MAEHGVRPSFPIGGKDVVIGLICVLMATLNLLLGVANDFVGLAILTVTMLVAFYPYASTALGAVVLFSGLTLFVVPCLGLIYVDAGVSPGWLALYIVVARTLLAIVGPDLPLPARAHATGGNLAMIAIWAGMGLAAQLIGPDHVLFHVGWAAGLVHLERICMATASKLARLAGFGIASLSVLAYAVFFWSGFGRLILATFFLAPLLLLVHYRTFRLNFLAFAFAAGALPFVGRVLRFGWSDGIAGLADDSGASPLTLTQGLWNGAGSVLYHEPLWHQWSLLFIQWFPRAWWPGKPVGLNYTFVDVFIGRQGLGEEHSTAIGYFGEHMFLASGWWWLSAAALTVTIGVMIRILRGICAPFFTPALIFNCWLITLFWGGMAGFGARVWFSAIPALAYIYILRRLSGAPAVPGPDPRAD